MELKLILHLRLTMSAENSIYQKIPQAVIFPKNNLDIQILFSILKYSYLFFIKYNNFENTIV